MWGYFLFWVVCDVVFLWLAMDPEIGGFGVVFLILSGTMTIIFAKILPTKEEKEREKIAQQKTLMKQDAAFYEECVKNGIESLDKEKDVQRAALIAQKMGLTFTDVHDLFDSSKRTLLQYQEKVAQEAAEATMKKEREREQQVYASLTKYADYFGREKRIAMLSEERKKYLDAVEALEAGTTALLLASQFQTKDSNWATMGGAASAIAGPAAGLAVATSMQAKTAKENARIREQNRRNQEYFRPAVATSYGGIEKNKEAARKIEEEIENAKTKLVADDSTSACFERLRFYNTRLNYSMTGTCIITTRIELEPFKIFDDVPAVIDGTITAKLYEDDKLICETKMVLPMYGVGEIAKLKGMALFCTHEGKKHRVEFEPDKLWAMEE